MNVPAIGSPCTIAFAVKAAHRPGFHSGVFTYIFFAADFTFLQLFPFFQFFGAEVIFRLWDLFFSSLSIFIVSLRVPLILSCSL